MGLLVLLMLLGLGVFIGGFALSRNFVLSCILIFLAGAMLLAVFTSISSLVQLIAPDNMRGRVISVHNVAFGAACRWEAWWWERWSSNSRRR